MNELQQGDTVRVRALPPIPLGMVVAVSTLVSRSRYLVAVPGHETRAYSAEELEQVATPGVGMVIGTVGRTGP